MTYLFLFTEYKITQKTAKVNKHKAFSRFSKKDSFIRKYIKQDYFSLLGQNMTGHKISFLTITLVYKEKKQNYDYRTLRTQFQDSLIDIIQGRIS